MVEAEGIDEFEYEYDPNETETFLVDLDLSSLNGVLRSRTVAAGRRALVQPIPTDEPTTPGRTTETPNIDTPNTLDENNDATPGPGSQSVTPGGATSPTKEGTSQRGKDLQILEFHSTNPIVSFEDQIYSCTWHDVIGTNLFFSEPEGSLPTNENSLKGEFDYLGSTRIKLVGHRARVTQRAPPKKRGRPGNEDAEEVEQIDGPGSDGEIAMSGKSLGDLHFSSATTNIEMRRQARFLEKFMNVKRARGEKDNVRTIVNGKMIAAMKQSQDRGRHDPFDQNAVNEEVARLNRRIIRGDGTAVARLQEIYSLNHVNLEQLPKLPTGLEIPVTSSKQKPIP